MAEGVDVVGIDEAQFFDDEVINVCEILALRGVRVIVAGLGYGLSRPSIRANAISFIHCRLYHQTARDLYALWQYCQCFIPQN
jgi:thymidine kinase